MPAHWTEDENLIAERLAAPPRLLVACDFDGTLAPLVTMPEKAALPEETRRVLRQLARAPGVSLAIISGRALADVRARVPLDDACFAGNHGMEIAGHGLDGSRSQAVALRPQLALFARELRQRLGQVPGVQIEDKHLSLAVHFRRAEPPRHEEIRQAVAACADRDPQFRVQPGHCVIELLPAIGWDKGEALKQIAGRLGIPRSAVFYAGDDTTDEAAFQAIPNGTTISVGAERPSAARWMARDPEEIRALLHWISELRRGL